MTYPMPKTDLTKAHDAGWHDGYDGLPCDPDELTGDMRAAYLTGYTEGHAESGYDGCKPRTEGV